MDPRYDGWPADATHHRHFCTVPSCENHYLCSQRDGCDKTEWTCPYHEQEERDAHTEQLLIHESTAPRSA